MDFNDFFEPDQIIGSTINGWITFPSVCLGLIYLLSAGMLIRIYLAHRAGQVQTVARTGLALLISTGLFHAAISDLTWTRWLIHDVRKFWGVPNELKPAAMDGDMFQFIMRCRAVIGNKNYILYPTAKYDAEDVMSNYFNRRLEYLMLPARKGAEAEYIIVMLDKSAQYDEKTQSLYVAGRRTAVASLLLKYNQGEALLLRKQ